jgi:hypothetical protein
MLLVLQGIEEATRLLMEEELWVAWRTGEVPKVALNFSRSSIGE